LELLKKKQLWVSSTTNHNLWFGFVFVVVVVDVVGGGCVWIWETAKYNNRFGHQHAELCLLNESCFWMILKTKFKR